MMRIGWGALAIGAAMTVATTDEGSGQLRGDAEATPAVDRTLEAIEGVEPWASVWTLELTYRGWWVDRPGDVIERAWRDLAHPNQRIEIEAASVEVAVLLTADAPRIGHSVEVEQGCRGDAGQRV